MVAGYILAASAPIIMCAADSLLPDHGDEGVVWEFQN